jgi:hypothetical protein
MAVIEVGAKKVKFKTLILTSPLGHLSLQDCLRLFLLRPVNYLSMSLIVP